MQKTRYEFIPHTADIQFKAYGETIEELFSNSLLAFKKSMTDDLVKDAREVGVEVVGVDNEGLLYNFLEELLVLFDSEHFIVSRVKDIEINDGKLKARVLGDSSEKYNFHIDIKAVTYGEMKVKEPLGSLSQPPAASRLPQWEAVVTLDV